MLTIDEARGLAAKVWTRPNSRRKVLDAQLCEEFANVLVDEIAKRGLDNTALLDHDRLKTDHDRLTGNYAELSADLVRLQNEYARLKARSAEDQKTWQASFDKIQNDHKALTLAHANLQSEHETLKLKVKPDEVV